MACVASCCIAKPCLGDDLHAFARRRTAALERDTSQVKYELHAINQGIKNDFCYCSASQPRLYICPSLHSTGNKTTQAVQNTCTLLTAK